jgi:hypothetical protein
VILSIVSIIISNGYMIHCGIGSWGKFIDKMNVIDLRYLISVLSIVPLKKGQSFDQVFGQIKNY